MNGSSDLWKAGEVFQRMKELESHEESQCGEVPQYRSGSDTTACRTSPTRGLLDHSPSSSHYEEYQDKNNPAGELPSFLLLPNDSLRSKYLEEREKLWKQLTADYCDSGMDSDGDGDEDEDIKDLQCKLPLIVSQPRSPTTNNDPEEEVKVLPEEVTMAFSNNSRSSYVLPAPRQHINNMQSTATRQEYQHGTSGNNIRPPPFKRATADLMHRPDNTSQSHSEKNAKKQRRIHYKSWCNNLDSKSEELKENKRKRGRCIDPERWMPFQKSISIMPPNIPPLSEGQICSQPQFNDVLCGQGNFAFCHPGNVYFRSLVSKYKLEYVLGKSSKKLTIAKVIVNNIQSLVPSGRFLKKAKGSARFSEKEAWQDVGEEAMIAKTKQALRIGAHEIKKFKALSRYSDHEKWTPSQKCLSIMPNIPSLGGGEISQIKCTDVICGKSFATFHPGNVYFRSLVSKYKHEYLFGNSLKKSTIANIIVNNIQSLVPSGRFLKKIQGSAKSSEKGPWQDIGEEAMIAKTRHALRLDANEQQKRIAMKRHGMYI